MFVVRFVFLFPSFPSPKGVSITRCLLSLLAGGETAEAQDGGPQPIETLSNARNMAPSNAGTESGAPAARDEEEDDDADGAADGTQRNDAEGGKQIRELRRFLQVRSWGHWLVCRTLLVFGSSRPECTSSTARVHLTRQRRTPFGAAFRPIAELDPGAITVKNQLGSRSLRW